MIGTLLLAVSLGAPVRSGSMPRTFLNLDESPAATTASSDVQLATDGTEYLVVWSEWTTTAFDAVAARFDLTGRLLEGPAIIRCGSKETATLIWSNGVYRLVFDGALFDIAPHSMTPIHERPTAATRIAMCGNDVVSASTAVAVGYNFGHNAGAYYRYDFTAEWLESGVKFARQSLSVSPQFSIPLPPARLPQYACNAERCVIICEIPIAGTSRLAANVLACGAGEFAQIIENVATSDFNFSAAPHPFGAAANGNDVLVAYTVGSGGISSTVDGLMLHLNNGGIVSTEPFVITPMYVSNPTVAAAGDGFVVAYDVDEGNSMKHIEALRVGAQPATPRHRAAR